MEQMDRRVRKWVFDYFLEHTSAPAVEEIASGCRLTLPQAAAALQRLDAAHHLKLLDGTGRILMAFPFSAVSTPYRVTRTTGQRYFANCAWDAITFHPMLREPLAIDSFCHHCGNPLHFRLESGHGVPDGGGLPTVYLALPAAAWWEDIVRTCANTMVFFESESHLGALTEAGAATRGAAMTVDQTIKLSEPLYSRKMELDYARPPKETLQAHFANLGLVGAFWQL